MPGKKIVNGNESLLIDISPPVVPREGSYFSHNKYKKKIYNNFEKTKSKFIDEMVLKEG